MSSFRNPFPEAGIPEYPPVIPFIHAEHGDTIHVAKKSLSSKILNLISVSSFPVNVILIMGSYGSGKTKLAYNTIYELHHPDKALAIGEQSIIFADVTKPEQKEETLKILNEKKVLPVYLTFESAFMKRHTLNNVVSIFRSALEELANPDEELNKKEIDNIPQELREKVKTSKIGAWRLKDILELLRSYFYRIIVFVDEFERLSERAEAEQKAIIESLRDDFINLFSTSDMGTLLIINYTPAVEYLISPAIERRARSIETGRFSYQTAKKVLREYLEGTEFITFFDDATIFSAFHLARDAGSQFLQICGEALTRAHRHSKKSIEYDDLLYSVRVIRDSEGQKLFSEAYYGTLTERLKTVDPDYPKILDCLLGGYYPRDIEDIAERTGMNVRKVETFINKFGFPSETFKGLGPLVMKCYFLDRGTFYAELEDFAKTHGIAVEELIDDLSKLLEVCSDGRRIYVVPDAFLDFRIRIGLTASEELHKGLKERSEGVNKYILSTEFLNNLVASPVGYEDILDVVKGRLKGEVRSYLAKPRSIYEKEKEAEDALRIIWEYMEK